MFRKQRKKPKKMSLKLLLISRHKRKKVKKKLKLLQCRNMRRVLKNS